MRVNNRRFFDGGGEVISGVSYIAGGLAPIWNACRMGSTFQMSLICRPAATCFHLGWRAFRYRP